MMAIGKNQTRTLVLAATVLLTWGVMAFGRSGAGSGLVEGEMTRQAYVARFTAEVEDEDATEAARDQAAAAVEVVYRTDFEAYSNAAENIRSFLLAVEESIDANTDYEIPAVGALTPITEPDGSTIPDPELTALLTVNVNLRVEGEYLGLGPTPGGIPNDRYYPMDGISVIVHNEAFQARTLVTDSVGTVTVEIPSQDLEVVLDASRPLPEWVVPSEPSKVVRCAGREVCEVELELLTDFRPLDEVALDLQTRFPQIDATTLTTLAELSRSDAISDLTGTGVGQTPHLERVEAEILSALSLSLRAGLTAAELPDEQTRILQNPPYISGLPESFAESARQAAGEVLATFLIPNESVDVDKTEEARQAARDAVLPEMVRIQAGDTIVPEFDRLTSFHIAAIEKTGAIDAALIPEAATLAILTVLVAVVGYYLSRFREVYWNETKMVILFGVLVVIAAISVRVTIENSGGYSMFILPAVGLGTLAAVLFDNRMGTLMGITLAALTAIASPFNSGLVVYALLATIAPIGFVSKASTRHAFRNSAVISAVAASGIAGVVAWYFRDAGEISSWPTVTDAMLWAFGVSLVAGLLAQPVLAFFEAAFDITTTMRLLDLTDRNHAALQLIQEEAFGTFNHSLMVGTLASNAARAIGANSLLARAAAYYHDIGKTQNPLFFIENQFGVPNPHDLLTPEESAEVIRRHVTDGLALAKKYHIPSEVAEGIVSHHGDGIMHYFYDKARKASDGDVDTAPFRHHGHKPKAKEMAILMLADAVESACRATFVEEEPKPENIAKVVNRVIDEKYSDGQLSECDLTQGELTKVRRAFIDSLTGHYHQRINYPNFPGV